MLEIFFFASVFKIRLVKYHVLSIIEIKATILVRKQWGYRVQIFFNNSVNTEIRILSILTSLNYMLTIIHIKELIQVHVYVFDFYHDNNKVNVYIK